LIVTTQQQENQSLKAQPFVLVTLALMLRQMRPAITSVAKHDRLSGMQIFELRVADIKISASNFSNFKSVLKHTRLALFGIIASLAAAFDIEFDP
jgi:hypothetical protein